MYLMNSLDAAILSGIAVIEYTKAPDTTTELCSISLLSGESHEYDFVAVVGQTGIVVIGV